MSIEEIIRNEMRNAINPVLQVNNEMRKEIQELKSIIAKKEDQLLTRIEAAKLLKKTPKTFDVYRKEGRVVRAGGTEERPLFWESEVLKLGIKENF